MRCDIVVAQGLSQRPIMKHIIMRWKHQFSSFFSLATKKMNWRALENDIYVKDPKKYKLQEPVNPIRIWTARSSKY